MKTIFRLLAIAGIFSLSLTSCDDAPNSADDGANVSKAMHGDEDAPSTSADAVTNGASASSSMQVAGKPQISFTDTFHDFGKIVAGEKVEHNFTFTNTGDAPLVIEDASASCGCTLPKYDRGPFAPGQSGKIQVQFNSAGKNGLTKKEVYLTTNAVPNHQNLLIAADIREK